MTKQTNGYFTEENSIDVVIQSISDECEPRLKEVISVLIRKLHEAVKELEPTQDEWMKAILFLTKTGHKTDDWRQEFILLSDILGVSMLVDAINSRRPNGASENTVLGPFHLADAPSLEMGANGLVLAAETAIGKHPISCVKFIKKMILSFKKY